MKTLIDLSTTVLNFPSVVQATAETIFLLNKEKTGLTKFPHACTILFGWEDILDPRWKTDISDTLQLETTLSPIFTAPCTWRLPHVLKALGAFKSNGEASKNGWNKDVEEGLHEHVCRIAHTKVAFSTFKAPALVCRADSWDLTNET